MKQNSILFLALSLFFISGLNAQVISVDPEQGFIGEFLSVTISGTDTQFESATGTCGTIEPTDITIEQNGVVYFPLSAITSGDLWLGMNVNLEFIPTGSYDITIWKNEPAGCEVSCEGCFEVLDPGSITDLDLTTGGQGEELKVTISGANTFWSQASPCSLTPNNIVFSQGSSTTFTADDIVVLSNDTLCAWITVPEGAEIGSFDIQVGADLGCETTCEGCFEVMFAPEIVFSSSNQGGQGSAAHFSLELNNGSFDCDFNTQNVYLFYNGDFIYPTSVEIIDNEFSATFDIPEDAAVGNYDLIVGAGLEYDCNYVCENCYAVTAAPAIVLPPNTEGGLGGEASISIGIDNGSYNDCDLTTQNVYLELDGNIIYPTSVEVVNEELVTTFNIPADATIGNYNLIVGQGLEYGCTFTCEACFEVMETIGVGSPIFDASLSVYPNPFNEQIFIHSDKMLQEVSLQMYDATGRLILSTRWDEFQNEVIDVTRLPKGVYTLKILAAEGESYKRVVRQ